MYNNIFRQKSIRGTKQRVMVMDILEKAETPLTADDIYIRASLYEGHIDLSTVYRTLEVFAEKGIVIKTNITVNNKALFETNREKHNHYLVCVNCRKMLSIDQCPLEGYEELLKKSTSFDILGHRLQVYGHCPECKKQTGKGENADVC